MLTGSALWIVVLCATTWSISIVALVVRVGRLERALQFSRRELEFWRKDSMRAEAVLRDVGGKAGGVTVVPVGSIDRDRFR